MSKKSKRVNRLTLTSES